MIEARRRWLAKVGMMVGGLILGVDAHADEAAPAAAAPCAAPSLSIEQLAGMSWCELEQLYREAPLGNVPCGFVHGRAIYCPGEKGTKRKSKFAQCVWRGKVFDPCCATMINQWRGVRAIKSRVYQGESLLDGKPATILDYRGTSRVWEDVHDEIREVCPGVWLGLMYYRECPCPRFGLFFALETPCCRK